MPIYPENEPDNAIPGTEFTEYESTGISLIANELNFDVFPPVPLCNQERGLLFSPTSGRVSEAGFTANQHYEPQDLRIATLFWDRIEYPLGGPITSIDDDTNFLAQEGVLQRTLVIHRPDKEMHVMEEVFEGIAYSVMAARYQQNANARWNIGLTEDAVKTVSGSLPRRDGLSLMLAPSLPVPNEEVPLDAVLEFKKRRRPELLALRAFIDELCCDVVTEPLKPLAEMTAEARLVKSVKDYRKSIRGINIPMRPIGYKINIDAKFSLDTIVKIGAKYAIKPEASTILEGAVDLLGLKVEKMVDLGTGSGQPLSYVSLYHKELFSKPF